MSKGLFITFEGPDGSGKTTQIEYLKEFLNEKGIPCLFTREPGGTNIGEKLREVILDKSNSEMCDMTEALLYAAARAQHVNEKIGPALEKGITVVCDRYVDSSVAYQGYGRNLGDCIREINDYATMGYLPDVTFLIMIDPKVGRSRIKSGDKDRLESEKLRFHKSVFEGYKKMAEKEPGRIIPIDGTGSREEMRDAILNKVTELLEERG